MDVSNASVLKTTNFFCSFSSLRPYSTSPSQFRKNPLRKNSGLSIVLLKIPSWNSSVVPRRGVFQISAQLRRPSRRRNTLREKLVSREEQVRKIPPLLKPDTNWEDLENARNETENIGLSLDLDKKEVDETIGSKKLNFSGNSALWDQLETWVDRYKEDSEFWGIGTGPILTIYQDSDGNFTRVSVNEDEIVKRSRARAWSFEQKGATEEFTDVKSKISRAKLIAKEIEAGEYTLPRNSSIAKFVTEGKKSSFVDSLRSVSLPREPLLKVFPRIGFMLLCGFCVFWATTRLFVGDDNDNVEGTREEVEMLRRKKKSRMERGKVEKGTVEVLQNEVELPMVSGTRPQLDRNELMDIIKKAKKSNESLVTSDSSSYFHAKDHDFDDKVREIREMARKARELERKDHSQNNKKGEGDDVTSILLASKGQNDTIENNAPVKHVSIEDETNHDSISETNSLLDHEKNIEFFVDADNKKMLLENSEDCMNRIPDGESSESFRTNRDTVTINVDDHEMDSTRYLKKTPTGIDAEYTTHSSIADILKVDSLRSEEVGQNKFECTILGERESNNISSGTSNFARKKPKIIRSIKQAREYLAEKRGISADKVKSKQEVQFKRTSTGQTMNEITEVAEPSKLSESQGVKVAKHSLGPYGDKDAVSLLKGSHINTVSETKSHEGDTKNSEFSLEIGDTKVTEVDNVDFQHDIPNGESEKPLSVNVATRSPVLDDNETGKMVCSEGLHTEFLTDSETYRMNSNNEPTVESQTGRDSCTLYASDNKQALESQGTSYDNSPLSDSSTRITPDMMEDGAYHSQQFYILSHNVQPVQEAHVRRYQDGSEVCEVTRDEPKTVILESKMVRSSESNIKSDFTLLPICSSEESTSNIEGFDGAAAPLFEVMAGISGDIEPSTVNDTVDDSDNERDLKRLPRSETNFSLDFDGNDCHTEPLPLRAEKSWVEENFQQFDPIIKKIGVGFKENYMVAKDKVQEESSLSAEISELKLMGEDEELEWMKDDRLREIVFQVRENELAGRDPFHLMDADDQQAFFRGLEHKAEKVNEKLVGLHEWIHSRIENLDYGADGISLDDPLDKIIPRWKGPAFDKDPEFLNKFTEDRKAIFDGSMGNSHVIKRDTQNSLPKSDELPNSNGVSTYSPINGRTSNGTSINPKTLIECSDGSSRPGKKTGKEHWQHTKKWSRGFLEVYNAESDPEIKSIMKDMGKDLDRWITEKEVQDVADLMTKIPKRKRRYIEKKMNKLKREVEMYGAPAVVSKYKEYSDEKEEDYLWWLDLQFVLCIELYTMEDGAPKIGFYSLEMAEDLELNPKQYHVIAFEDPGDSKNLCYILQAHMDMLGTGRAFIVARPPKDAFQEAKANGFSVTVIRKGEIKLNVDQTLEEVEEEITEIGSKIYHDKIMRERSVDISTLMKGVISADKSTKRRSKRKRVLTKPAKS